MAEQKDPKVAYITDAGGHHVSIDMPRHPPRLSVALMWAKPGERSMWQTTLDRQLAAAKDEVERKKLYVDLNKDGAFDAELNRLLLHIVERLENGLEEAWMSKYGYDAPSPGRKEDETQGAHAKTLSDAVDRAHGLLELYNQPEEQWARAFSEMCVYVPYAGPGQMILGSWEHDGEVLREWPKVYSFTMACQHLSSYGVVSRGFPATDLGNGLTAGPNAGVKIFRSPTVEGDPKRAKWIDDQLADYMNQNLRPGDVAGGNDSVDQKGFAHIGSILRRWPLGKAGENAGSAAKLQAIDTGVLASFGDYNTQDHDWLAGLADKFARAPPNRRGLGRVPTPTDLAGGIAAMKKALPMGFARLILCERGGRVRFVSALLPMWSGTHRFAVSRYIWSIRDLPAQNGLVAYWAMFAPVGRALFKELVTESASPTRTAAAILAAAEGTRVELMAVCSSEPRVVREMRKKKEPEWKEVHPSTQGPDAQGAAPTEMMPTGQFTKLPLTLDEGKSGAAAWGVIRSSKTFAEEMVRADTNAKKLDEKPATGRGVRYFSGTAAPPTTT